MLSTFLDSGECSFQSLVLIPFVDTNHCSPEEKFDCYMLTAGVMTCGGIEFKTKGRDDQAECELIGPDTFPGKAAGAFQIDPFQMIKVFCKPRIKVGTEWVTKGQTCDQATALCAFCKVRCHCIFL